MSRRTASAQEYEHTGRCASCYSNLDREGRVCCACLRRNRWKLALGCVVALECAGAGWYFKNGRESLHLNWPATATASAERPAPTQAQANAGAVLGRVRAASATADALFAGFSRADGGSAGARGDAAAGGGRSWAYFETRDEVLGDVTRHARLVASLAPVRFGRIVQETVAATLELTRSTRYGDNVVVRLPRQRLACAANACGIRAWFDRAGPEQYAFAELPDDTHTVLAIADKQRFAERMRGARRVVMVAALGTAKPVTMAFDVAGYGTAEAAIRQFAAALRAAAERS